jgi:hypothetical protein
MCESTAATSKKVPNKAPPPALPHQCCNASAAFYTFNATVPLPWSAGSSLSIAFDPANAIADAAHDWSYLANGSSAKSVWILELGHIIAERDGICQRLAIRLALANRRRQRRQRRRLCLRCDKQRRDLLCRRRAAPDGRADASERRLPARSAELRIRFHGDGGRDGRELLDSRTKQ